MENILLKKLGVTIILFVSASIMFAQNNKHEISVYAGGGLSTLSYEAATGKKSDGAGGNLGVGYTYFFADNLGVNTGVEFALYNAKVKREAFNDVSRYLTDSSDGEIYDFYSSIKNYEEKQEAMYLNIPLMLQFQYGEKNKLYASAGVKIGIPVNAKYKSSASEITNKGFFYDTGNWAEDQEFRGFGTYSDYNYEEDIDFKIAYMFSAELGMKWQLTDKMGLYTGAYIDYGLNDIVKGENDRYFTKLEETSDGIKQVNNSFLNSTIGYSSNTFRQELVDKVIPMAAGLRLRLSFNM
ncbi:MAG: outer membrane beta-barrel protein [Dysgonomonas sp.]|nr:outer membrane beta-barrel protein [Dysgonomonas sp.]